MGMCWVLMAREGWLVWSILTAFFALQFNDDNSFFLRYKYVIVVVDVISVKKTSS